MFFHDELRAWESAGILGVFAAGNAGPASQTIRFPAHLDLALTVGASTPVDKIEPRSSRGGLVQNQSTNVKPDVVAPGAGILTLSPTNPCAYDRATGTSMAAPIVAGAAALALQHFPNLSPAELRDGIRKSALPLSSSPNPVFGHGRVRIVEFIELLSQSRKDCI